MAVDVFLKVDGVDGESKDGQYKNHIEVLSFSWGMSQTRSFQHGTGGGAGKVSMNDFSFMMAINKSTPKLMTACATGQHIKKATLFCRKAGGKQENYLTYTMEDVLVSSYQTSGSSEIPMDSCSFNFAKITVDYAAQKETGGLDGAISFKYDLKANKKF